MTIIEIAKLMKLEVPRMLFNILNLMKPSYNNRVYLPKLKLNQYQNNFCYQAPKLWNQLTSSSKYCNSITKAPFINTLKTRLKRFLLEMQSYGSENEWFEFNKSISNYLIAIKSDPYQ